MIQLKNMSFGYGEAPLFKGLTCAFEDGKLTCVVGPNGSGKSTCLKLCARLLRPGAGEIAVDGRPASAYDARAFARALAFLPQSRPLPAITVRSLVSHGRFAYLGLSHRLRPADEEAGGKRPAQNRHARLRRARTAHASGGHRQKAYLAMLIAQGAQNLLLDEPMTYLDVRHQLELLELLHALRDAGKCVVMVVHDLALACEEGDRALLLHEGAPLYDGSAAGLLASGCVETAFRRAPASGRGALRARVICVLPVDF